MKKGQAANEFIILIGLTMLVVGVFAAIEAREINYTGKVKESRTFTDFGKAVQKEIFIASEVNDGYVREFFLPDNVNGHDYEINNTSEEIIIISKPNMMYHSFLVPEITGNIKKGWNRINRTGGVIYLN